MENRQKLPVYLLAAPIGEHLTDISYGVLKLLGQLDVILAENTETDSPDDLMAKLRARNVIKPGTRIVPLSENDDKQACLAVVDECVAALKPFGIMADSGIACFIDPGVDVVRHIIDKHGDVVELVPIGTSSALDAAIMMSGVDCTNFVFMGHFPETPRWFTEHVLSGVPGIAYVRGDSLREFLEAARREYGAQSGLLVSLFKNIRGLARRARLRFALDAGPGGIDSLAACERSENGSFCDNFVAIVHHPQNDGI